MLLGELVTARMHNLPVKVVVFNNSTLGMVKLEMLVGGLPDFGTDVHDVSYTGVARSIGLHAERVEDPKNLRQAFQRPSTSTARHWWRSSPTPMPCRCRRRSRASR